MKVCYFCGALATSVEHVPPRGLFPSQKDVPMGVDYRKQLITVPACSRHNNATAKDDEYAMYVLAMSIPANDVGEGQFRAKIMRAMERNPALMARILGTKQPVLVHDRAKGTWRSSVAFKADEARLRVVFEKVARGVLFHEEGIVWNGRVLPIIEFARSMEDLSHNWELENLGSLATAALARVPERGQNPEVFKYRLTSDASRYLMRLQFYGDASVLALFSPGAG